MVGDGVYVCGGAGEGVGGREKGGGGSEGGSVALAINRADWEQSDGANGRGPAEKRPLYGGRWFESGNR